MIKTFPLVSVCVTFSSAERFIHRVFDSCLNQTYRNIEVVVVDNASTDGSEKVIRKYAARDPRVKYFRRTQAVGLSPRLLEMFQRANGEFVMMIGADDWLARDYIENGVRSFLAHPGAAGVVPRLISLREAAHDEFTYLNETFDLFSPPHTFSSEWFVKRMYRSTHLYISALALMRKKDAVGAMDYFLKHYCDNPPPSLPTELRGFFVNGFGVDAVLFLEVLTRYKSFVFDSSLCYLKVAHGKNLQFDLGQESLPGILKNAYYYLLTYSYMYGPKWKRFLWGMKISRGAELVSSALIYIAGRGIGGRSVDKKRGPVTMRDFFRAFSLPEMAAVIFMSLLRIMGRGIWLLLRTVSFRDGHQGAARQFSRGNFLDLEGRFAVN